MPEDWHLLSQYGEDVLFLNVVMQFKMRAEIESGGEELSHGYVGGALA